jgi:hypothetical protein
MQFFSPVACQFYADCELQGLGLTGHSAVDSKQASMLQEAAMQLPSTAFANAT